MKLPTPSTQSLKRFLWRHHYIVFIVICGSAVIAAMLSLISVINQPTPPANTSTQSVSFDKATIQRINMLGANGSSFTLPSGQRIDPFKE